MLRAMPKVFMWMLIFILCIAGGVSSVMADGGGSSSLSIQGSSTVPENTQSQYTAYYNCSRVSAFLGRYPQVLR